MERIANGIVHRAQGSIFGYHGWGSVARDEAGTLYAVASAFRVSHVCPFGKTAMYISKNGGKTWTPPIVINDTYLDDRDAGIVYLGNGRMVVSWFTHSAVAYQSIYADCIRDFAEPAAKVATQGMLEGYDHLPEREKLAGSYVRVSEDYGVTWSEPILLPISAPHGPSLCRDGSLIYLGVEIYDSDRVTFCKDIGSRPACLYRSRDGGYTWEKEATLPVPAWQNAKLHIDEPHVLELPDGSLLGAFRVEGDFSLAFASSPDGGKTWSEISMAGIKGSPPHLMLHSSGAVICSYGYRSVPYGEHAIVSYDLGKTWSEPLVLCEARDGDIGYPCTVEMDDGSLFTVYYQRYADDAKPSMLYTRWRL